MNLARLVAYGYVFVGFGLYLFEDLSVGHDNLNKTLNANPPIMGLIIAFALIGIGSGVIIGRGGQRPIPISGEEPK